MRKLFIKWIPLLILALLVPLGAAAQEPAFVPFSQIEYVRPDMAEMQQLADSAAELAQGSDTSRILSALFDFYDAYDWFYTCTSLSNIGYSSNLKDKFWKEEYDFCMANSAAAEQMLDDLYYALSQSPARKKLERTFFGSGFFSGYDGERFWDDELVALMERESELISQYYVQSEKSNNFLSSLLPFQNRKMVQTLVDLVAVRQQIAAHAGYDSYAEFADDYYYYRDYTSDELDAYFDAIRQELVPLYRRTADLDYDLPETEAEESFRFVRDVSERLGGVVWDAFRLMEDAGLYDIAYSKNKYNSSFEVYLTSFMEPFVFMNPQKDAFDHLTLAHEFGHFCNDYASDGSLADIDICEVFSQGMEYLALCYGEDTQALTRAKLLDSLYVYVEEACYASFERQLYRLPAESLNVETVEKLYEETARAFGFDAIGYEKDGFVTITHFYTNPMYVSSYILSNDAAMQLYQMETEVPGSGLKCFLENLDTEEYYFLSFVESAGLESPFAPGRMSHVRESLEAALAA